MKKSQEYAVSLAGTPFIDALIKQGVISDRCQVAFIECRAGQPIKVTQEIWVDGEAINHPDVTDAIEPLAASGHTPQVTVNYFFAKERGILP